LREEAAAAMSREQSYMRMLSSAANMQWNIAVMLEAKAAEAEKMRSWFVNHVTGHSLGAEQAQLGQSLQIHDQVIEMIDGMTKLNQGMVSIIKAVVPQDDDDDGGFGDQVGGFGKGMSFGGKM
jgi:hypothetical protein